MTPTELDAIFRAWRDGWFAKNPEATEWTGEAIDVPGMDESLAWDMLVLAELRGEASLFNDFDWTVPNPAFVKRFDFPDPSPLPADVPIPFPAGKALLEQPPLTFADIHSLAEEMRKAIGVPETGRYWRVPHCPACGKAFSIDLKFSTPPTDTEP